MADVLEFTGLSRISLPASKVLEKAMSRDLADAIVIGRTKDDGLYFHATTQDGGDVLWLIELIKKHLLDGDLEE